MRLPGTARHATLGAALVALALGCSREVLSVVLDMPPAKPKPTPAQRGLAIPPGSPLALLLSADTVRPPIEQETDSERVRKLLPRDLHGNIDWVRALRDGTIKPRRQAPGVRPVAALPGGEFGYDLYMSEDTSSSAFFPHSAHVEWSSCASCHPRLFARQREPIDHDAMRDGKFCGACHGKVAFPIETACERCHQGMGKPQSAQGRGELLGDVTMRRFDAESVRRDSLARPDSAAQPPATPTAADSSRAARARTDSVTADSVRRLTRAQRYEIPPSRFSHWPHRIRYRCQACHPAPFAERAGATVVTMDAIARGQYCGRCHDGVTAFAVEINGCARCHVEPKRAELPAPRSPTPVAMRDYVNGLNLRPR